MIDTPLTQTEQATIKALAESLRPDDPSRSEKGAQKAAEDAVRAARAYAGARPEGGDS